MTRSIFSLLSIVIMLAGGRALASDASLVANVELDTAYSSNIFMNTDRIQDFTIRPGVMVGADFGQFWTAGYEGELRVFTMNTDLINHGHTAFLLVNPAWGNDAQNEFMARVAIGTQRFMDAWATLNNLRPTVDAAVALEPASWFRLTIGTSGTYTWFYDDPPSDYADFSARVSTQFTLQSKTTITPRFEYAFRYYPRAGTTVTTDRQDHQVTAGIHFSQGVWKNAGIQADYSYTHVFDVSALVVRNRDVAEFSYLEDTFLYAGHSASFGLKQVAGGNWSVAAGVVFEQRLYSGWAAVDSAGAATGDDRLDYRLGPHLSLEYLFSPDADAARSVPEVKVVLGYGYVRQWSNHAYYDTDRHYVSGSVVLNW